MKKLILLGALLLGAARVWATDPVHMQMDSFGGYSVTYVGVTASSTTAGSISAMGSTRWREVHCVANDLAETETINSAVSSTAVSTTTLATAGSRFPFTANLGRHWNTSKGIYFSVAAGAASVALDCEVWTER